MEKTKEATFVASYMFCQG